MCLSLAGLRSYSALVRQIVRRFGINIEYIGTKSVNRVHRRPIKVKNTDHLPGPGQLSLHLVPPAFADTRRYLDGLQRAADMTDASTLTKSIDADGAGGSALSPELQLFMTGALRALFARYGFPVANARIEDVQDLLGGALFLPLYKWMLEVMVS